MADIKTRFLRAAFPVQMEWVMLCERTIAFQFHLFFVLSSERMNSYMYKRSLHVSRLSFWGRLDMGD